MLLTVGFATTASAQGGHLGSFYQRAKMQLSNAIDIELQSAQTVTLNFTSVNNYASHVKTPKQTLRVRSNRKFTISVKTNSANFSYAGTTTPAPIMPVNVLRLRLRDRPNNTTPGGTFLSTFTPLSNTDQTMVAEAKRGGNQIFKVKYQARPGFDYPAGTYTTTVVYTATQL